MAYTARLSYQAIDLDIAADDPTYKATWEANPSQLTNYDNWVECASHFVTAFAEIHPVESVSFDEPQGYVHLSLADGTARTFTVEAFDGELLLDDDTA